MNKFQIVKALRTNGDSIITLFGDLEPIGATLDFSERYIKRKRAQRFTILKDCILLFSWTDDSFRNIKVKDIKSILPLASLLKNQPPPELKTNGKKR